jgi:acylphosphatase
MPGLTREPPAVGGDPVACRVVVSGRVQGVWFRETCRGEAEARAVHGWVVNRGDGRVEALFEGPPAAVEAMVAWCREGPPRAVVTGVDVEPEQPTGARAFRVL